MSGPISTSSNLSIHSAYVAPKPHVPKPNFQNTNSPDINLERDIIEPGLESEIALGMEVSEISRDNRFRINISTIIISALLFLMILAWFDFIQTSFYSWVLPESQVDIIPASAKFWYAIVITAFIIIMIILIYYYSREYIK
ncbi:Hypothetical protein HVR_LOCUS720 [uncultured virus]|nr:Hypothetical protein HVR_LOCUS720 [uncultured virus]